MTGMDSVRRLDSLPWPMKGDSGAKYRRLLPRWHWCSVRLAPPLKISIAPYLCLPQRPPAISRVNALANPIQPDVRLPRYICRLHHDLLRTEPNRAVSVARYFRRPP